MLYIVLSVPVYIHFGFIQNPLRLHIVSLNFECLLLLSIELYHLYVDSMMITNKRHRRSRRKRSERVKHIVRALSIKMDDTIAVTVGIQVMMIVNMTQHDDVSNLDLMEYSDPKRGTVPHHKNARKHRNPLTLNRRTHRVMLLVIPRLIQRATNEAVLKLVLDRRNHHDPNRRKWLPITVTIPRRLARDHMIKGTNSMAPLHWVPTNRN